LVPTQCSRQVEIVSPIDALALVVASGYDAKSDARPIGDELDRNQKAAIELKAVSRDCIHLLRRVSPPPKTFRCASGAHAENREHAVAESDPFALNTKELRSKVEDQVVTLVCKWAKHSNPELDRFGSNARFRDRSLLIRCHLSQHSDRPGWAVSVWDTCGSGWISLAAPVQPECEGHDPE
jgi:hypothetical protein